MPREHIWGNVITVHRGDLPVLAARTARDVTQLDARTAPSHPPVRPTTSDRDVADVLDDLATARSELTELRLRHGVLRRRHQLLSAFAQAVGDLTTEDLVSSAGLRQRLDTVTTALEALPLDDPDVDEYGPSLSPDEAAELVLLREFARDVAQANARDGVPLEIRERFTDLTNRLAESLLDLRRPTDASPTARDAAHPTRTDPVTTGPGWRTPHPDCPRRDYVHAGHRDPLPPDATTHAPGGVLDCPGYGPTYDAARDYAAEREPDAAPDAPDPVPADDLVQLQLALVLSWVRDGGIVNVGIIGHDHATGREHDVGSFHLTLDWGGANRLIKKTRVARDQSHGAPE